MWYTVSMASLGMQCPRCQSYQIGVQKSRLPFRHRKCRACGFTWRTQEIMQDTADLLISLTRLFDELPDTSALKRRMRPKIAKLLKGPDEPDIKLSA